MTWEKGKEVQFSLFPSLCVRVNSGIILPKNVRFISHWHSSKFPKHQTSHFRSPHQPNTIFFTKSSHPTTNFPDYHPQSRVISLRFGVLRLKWTATSSKSSILFLPSESAWFLPWQSESIKCGKEAMWVFFCFPSFCSWLTNLNMLFVFAIWVWFRFVGFVWEFSGFVWKLVGFSCFSVFVCLESELGTLLIQWYLYSVWLLRERARHKRANFSVLFLGHVSAATRSPWYSSMGRFSGN